MEVREPDMTFNGYTYADYLNWTIPEMVELIKGSVFKMNAPKRIHQKISGIVGNKIYTHLIGQKCEMYDAPFDVRLPIHSKKKRRYLYRSSARYLCYLRPFKIG